MKKFLAPIVVFCLCLPLRSHQISKNYPGLVGVWHFNEGSGTTTVDAMGNGNTGTLTNTPTWETSPTMGWRIRTGTVSKYISIANEAQFDFDKTDSFYMGVVFNRTLPYSNGEMPMGKMTWDSSGYRMNIHQVGGINRPGVTVKSGANFAVYASSINMNDYLDGKNHSWITTYDGKNTPTSWRLYIDGNDGGQLAFIFGDQTITGAAMLNDDDLEISNSVGTVEWQGAIDEAFIGRGPISSIGAKYLGLLMLRKDAGMMIN